MLNPLLHEWLHPNITESKESTLALNMWISHSSTFTHLVEHSMCALLQVRAVVSLVSNLAWWKRRIIQWTSTFCIGSGAKYSFQSSVLATHFAVGQILVVVLTETTGSTLGLSSFSLATQGRPYNTYKAPCWTASSRPKDVRQHLRNQKSVTIIQRLPGKVEDLPLLTVFAWLHVLILDWSILSEVLITQKYHLLGFLEGEFLLPRQWIFANCEYEYILGLFSFGVKSLLSCI